VSTSMIGTVELELEDAGDLRATPAVAAEK
jgi:hypothetical protein